MTRKNGKRTSHRVALTGLLCLICFATNHAQSITAKIDEYMKKAVKHRRFTGAVLVAKDGRVLLSKGYGMASIEYEVPNTPQTKFRIGSLTKQFTAMAIMMLQERGKLSVRDPICKYLPDCPESWRSVTIHHLLTHTSGIPNFSYSLNCVESATTSSLFEYQMERLRKVPLDFSPGTQFSYSNAGYVLLGQIIEIVSGERYDAFLQENIFVPLNMKNTGYEDRGSIIKHRATGYSIRNDKLVDAPFVDMLIPYSAGGLYSTVEDLYLWDQSLYTERLVSKKSLEAMFTPFKNNYGYGWDIFEQFGRRSIGHLGWIDGYATIIQRFPDEKLVIIILSNLDSVPVVTMARDLAAIVFGVQHDLTRDRKIVQVDPKVYDAYVGQYELAPNFIITITKEGGKLMAQAPGRQKIELLPESEIEFFVNEYDARIVFIWNTNGQVNQSIISLNGREIPAKKIK